MLRLRHSGVRASTIDEVRSVVDASESAAMRDEVDATQASDDIVTYVTGIVRATRSVPSVELGASPRAAVHLLAASKAFARLQGRAYVVPDDVATMTLPVLRHRLVLRPEAELERYKADDVVRLALSSVTVPR